jgi:hypothetical protein
MAGRRREPTEADGPLLRAAYQRAKEIRGEPGPVRRRKGWATFLAVAAAALAEVLLREVFIGAAALSSVLAIVFGLTAGDTAWAVPMAVCGFASVALIAALWRTHCSQASRPTPTCCAATSTG